ncbi:LarC family nickel insertion protein [Companilactobacillus muriivasis]|uniref:LarC family nickel insertion protein n=1 Tax=Companilactobacillus muriivasis TaxID=3081444 RepID=UPI0030C6FC2D
MKRVLYLDCQYGIAGDMLLSSLLDLGVDTDYLIAELKKATNFKFELGIKNNDQYGITAKHLELKLDEHIHPVHGHHHNHYSAIKQLINESQLNDHVKKMSLDVFETIAKSEGKIHNVPVDDVAFHEVGAVDSIIDIIGNCIAIDKLDVDEIYCSPVATGYGKINIHHGLYPIPTPATLDMLTGVPLSGFESEGELTTPTGAAIVKTLTDKFKNTVNGQVEAIGYGCGTKEFNHPNIVRSILFLQSEKKKM